MENQIKKEKLVYDVGVYHKGRYKCKINKKHTIEYTVWHDMIRRCYNPLKQKTCPTYIGCTVCEEWKEFQVFAEWYNQNLYQSEEKLHLDKDILVKDNKVYSPEYCILVPQSLNKLFTKTDKLRGDCPIGVHWHSRDNVYMAQINIDKKVTHIGYYDNKLDAFTAYAKKKKEVMFLTLQKYLNLIPDNIYNILLEAFVKYNIEYND